MSGLYACSSLHEVTPTRHEPAELQLTDHPLVDTIYDVHTGHRLDRSDLLKALPGTNYLLLGETHDNISHHRNQGWIIGQLGTLSRSTSVSFEMIDERQGAFIEHEIITSGSELVQMLTHVDTGWGYDTYYRELFDTVIKAGFTIHPANMERSKLANIIMHNSDDVPPETTRIMSQFVMSPELEHGLEQDIIASHCGVVDANAARPMMRGQRIRDAHMAASLLQSQAELRVLIAGNSHVRSDRGVPAYLLPQESSARVISIAMLEVEDAHNAYADYAEHWETGQLPFDYVWFTARAERTDPCIGFRRTRVADL